ncbi:GNAT family N-acetyltransferase [Nocardia sp. NPDC052566]|uniref:GNAT family N-acetyltransferase n=1 Tax=Nocardia sp. NPDC052566 TaxID=3364330 RepID=UPI0037CB6FD5
MTLHRVDENEWQLARAVRLEALAESRSGAVDSALDIASAWDEAQWRTWLRRQTLFVCEDDGCFLGSAAGTLDSDDLPSMTSVWVRPTARGTGISDLLISAVTDWARARGHHLLRLWLTDSNTHADALYRRLGFTPTGGRRQAVDNPSVVEVEMTLPLVSGSAITSSRYGPRPEIRLRLFGPADEHQFQAVRARLYADGFEFARNYVGPWTSYLDHLDRARRGVDLAPGKVPETFLVAEDTAGQIVGTSDIRHHLTEQLMHWGGHIGYVVVPERRRLGYATEILRRTLPLARNLGINRARMTCRSDNVGSRRVITRCGGELDRITDDGICQYWLPT